MGEERKSDELPWHVAFALALLCLAGVVSYGCLLRSETYSGVANGNANVHEPQTMPRDWGYSGAFNLGTGSFDDLVSGKTEIVFDATGRPRVIDHKTTP
jgi:hypothetical protein